MGGKRRESGLRALRRGAALGLALTALWIFGLTADLSGAWDALGRLGQTPSFVLGALSQELEGASAGDGLSPDLDRWGRLLLAQSALLSGGRRRWTPFLAEQAPGGGAAAEPIDQEENDPGGAGALPGPARRGGGVHQSGEGRRQLPHHRPDLCEEQHPGAGGGRGCPGQPARWT